MPDTESPKHTHTHTHTHTQNLLSLDEKKIGEGFSKERELV